MQTGCCGNNKSEIEEHLEFVICDGEEVVEMMKDYLETAQSSSAKSPSSPKSPASPNEANLPVEEYIHPDRFEEWREFGESLGFPMVFSGPFVRSSYMADAQVPLS